MTSTVKLQPHELDAINRVQAIGTDAAEAELEGLMKMARRRRQAVAGSASPLEYLTGQELNERNALVTALTLTASPHQEARWRVMERERAGCAA